MNDTDDVFRALVALQERGEPSVLATVVKNQGSTPGKPGARMLLPEAGGFVGTVGGGCVEHEVIQAARRVLSRGVPELVEFSLSPEQAADEGLACGGRLWVFLEPVLAPGLVIFGAGHVGQALCELASRCGFRVTVMDDRARFAAPERLPGATTVLARPFSEAASLLAPTERDALVVMTRGHRHDSTCLRYALGTHAGYVGMISSRAKRKVIFERLVAQGVATPGALERIHAPIGLRIGSVTPWEIAVSVTAELIAWRRHVPERLRPPRADEPEAAWRARAGLGALPDSATDDLEDPAASAAQSST